MLCLVIFLRSGDVGFRRDNDEAASCCLLPPTRLLELVWRRENNNDRDNIRGMVDYSFRSFSCICVNLQQ